MSEVKWIKIMTSLFDNRKIRQIEVLPEGDSIIVIWFKLLCLAGNINDEGFVYFTKEIPYTEQMMATQFNRPISIIQLALRTFQEFGMIEVIDDMLRISNWEKYQNIEGMERIREQNRLRKQKQREREKLLLLENNDMSRDSNVTVTQQNKNKKEDIDKNIKDIYSSEDIHQIIDYLNQVCGTHYRYGDKTIGLVKTRMKEGFTVDDFKTVIDKKFKSWGKSDMAKYLRPETLFGTKFEGYLNEKETEYKKNTDWDWDNL